jgi:hypothetical protein
VDQDGCLNLAVTRPYGGSLDLQERRTQRGGETKDRLGHRRKHGEEHMHARVRVYP